jgi:hypothetical protein
VGRHPHSDCRPCLADSLALSLKRAAESTTARAHLQRLKYVTLSREDEGRKRALGIIAGIPLVRHLKTNTNENLFEKPLQPAAQRR